jgi:pimeloyl-ACP methyl ester carboxylesterase
MIAQRRARYAGFGTREIYTEGQGPTIVLLHGFGDASDCWRLVLERLDRIGRAAVAVDLAGFGDADPLRPGPRLPQLEQFVADVVTRHATDAPVVLVGNSLGGLLSIRAAASRHGLPVRGLLAIGAPGSGWTKIIRLAIVGPVALLAAVATRLVPSATSHRTSSLVMRRLLYGHWRVGDPVVVAEFLARLRGRYSTPQLVALAMAIVAEVRSSRSWTDTDCPAVVLHGRRDLLVSVATARALHRMMPHSRLVLLSRSGHCPQLDASEVVVSLAVELATGNRDDRSDVINHSPHATARAAGQVEDDDARDLDQMGL